MFLPFIVLLKTVKHSFFTESQVNLGLLKPCSAFILSRLSRPYIAAWLQLNYCFKLRQASGLSIRNQFLFKRRVCFPRNPSLNRSFIRRIYTAIKTKRSETIYEGSHTFERRLYGSDIANSHIVHICWHLRKNRPRRQRKHKRLLSMRKMLCRMPCCTTRRHDATRGNSKPTTRTN